MSLHRIHLATDLIEPCQRVEAWREITRPFFEVRPIEEGQLLEGALTSTTYGPLLVGPTRFNAQAYHRNQAIVAASGLDQYMVQLFLDGSLKGDCDGEFLSVRPGDICVFDLSRVFTTQARPGSTVTLIVPRGPIDKIARGVSLHGAVLRAAEPVTRILSDMILTMRDSEGLATVDAIEVLVDGFIHLLANALVRLTRRRHFLDSAHPSMLRRRAQTLIEDRLADPDLGPEALAQSLNVSRAHLYRTFAADGGVARVIADRRLDAALQALTRPGPVRRSITEIAYAYGFSSSGQFLRSFKTRFNMTPSEARSLAVAYTGDTPLQAIFAQVAQQYQSE
jgi:AraC-like DNA-binding protein